MIFCKTIFFCTYILLCPFIFLDFLAISFDICHYLLPFPKGYRLKKEHNMPVPGVKFNCVYPLMKLPNMRLDWQIPEQRELKGFCHHQRQKAEEPFFLWPQRSHNNHRHAFWCYYPVEHSSYNDKRQNAHIPRWSSWMLERVLFPG